MSEDSELIAGALREMAGRAVVPRLNPDAVWKAGRRRRRLRVLAAPAAVACAMVAATVVPLSVVGGTSHPVPGFSGGDARTVGPLAPPAPVHLREVASISNHSCPLPDHGLPGIGSGGCFDLTGTTLTLTRFESVRSGRLTTGQYALDLQLTPGDARQFADLTRKVAGQTGVHRQLAIIVGGQVVAHPVIMAPVTDGRFRIVGPAPANTENLLITLLGCPAASHAIPSFIGCSVRS
jgi:SecDF, P1 head subdomain